MTLEAKPNFRSLGKKFGKKTPLAAKIVAALRASSCWRSSAGGGVGHGEWRGVPLLADDLTIVRRASGSLVVQEENGFFAAIDPTITPELQARRDGT